MDESIGGFVVVTGAGGSGGAAGITAVVAVTVVVVIVVVGLRVVTTVLVTFDAEGTLAFIFGRLFRDGKRFVSFSLVGTKRRLSLFVGKRVGGIGFELLFVSARRSFIERRRFLTVTNGSATVTLFN